MKVITETKATIASFSDCPLVVAVRAEKTEPIVV